MTENDRKHHVAWADRIGLNKRWAEAIKKCLDSYGTNQFPIDLKAFKLIFINIKNGPQLAKMLIDFESKDLNEQKSYMSTWIENNPEYAKSGYHVADQHRQIRYILSERTFQFMVQTLEDEGFCFYESTIEEDEMI